VQFDVPGKTRVDSIIFEYRGTKAVVKSIWFHVLSVLQRMKAGTIGHYLPVLQYKDDDLTASVADYKGGRSFGEILCKRYCAHPKKEAFLKEWVANLHPTSENWDFDMPKDF